MKPFLKWVGGKTQIIDKVIAEFPASFENYHEPFLGGGSVLLKFLSERTCTGKVYASDLNPHLIRLYKAIQTNPSQFIDDVKELVNEFSECVETGVNRSPSTLEEAKTSDESYYYWIRARFNREHTPAMFLFLNKTCFRGMYREGPNGFNVPFGHYKSTVFLDEDHIHDVSKLIQNVVFTCQSFSESLQHVKKEDFAYLDPPYAPKDSGSFVGYNSDGFGLSEHNALFQKCYEMTSTGARFLMSNADVPLVRNAFPDPYKLKIVVCRRTINAENPAATANEVLITNFS
jgi:DNA adenine methylase